MQAITKFACTAVLAKKLK